MRFQCSTFADDLERDFSRAIAAGATVIMKPERKPWGETMGFLRDVNGLIIELCERQAPG